jgi:antitoxin component of RelBE/YafQ-DinJ toxin-antitoxin module
VSEIAPAAPAVDTGTSPAQTDPGGEAAPETPAAAPWKPPKVKVYGREVEFDEATYHKHAQTGAAFAEQSRKLAADRAELERQRAAYANAVPVDRLKSDTAAVLKELGIDPLKWSADQLVKTHETETLPPEQKALNDREAAVAAKEKEFQAREQRAEQERHQAATQARRADLGQRFVEALTSAQIPEGPASWPYLEAMVDHQNVLDGLVQEWHRTNGAGGVSPEEAAQRGGPQALAELAIEEVRQKDVAKWGKFSGADLLNAIPREVGDRYLEARVLEHNERRAAGGPREPLVARPSAAAPRVVQQQAGPAATPRDPTNGKYTNREHLEFVTKLGLG